MNKPQYILICGLPATGKSTLVNKLKNNHTFIYSTDSYIESVAKSRGTTYDKIFSDTIDEATQILSEQLKTAIEQKKDIIHDQTNLHSKKRKKIARRAKQEGYDIQCVCIVPPEVTHIDDVKAWNFRLKSRPGKHIPQDILTSMIKSYELPRLEEGFDNIKFVNMWGEEIK